MAEPASMLRRVTFGAAGAAALAATLAAFATSGLAAWLIGQGEDRRLTEAAVTFADELDEGPADAETIRAVYLDESAELKHTGMVFAVHDAEGRWLEGDRRPAVAMPGRCVDAAEARLRVCAVATAHGLRAVVADTASRPLTWLVWAALGAALLAALAAAALSRPLARGLVAPLSRLRARIAGLEVQGQTAEALGPAENVVEIDQVRDALIRWMVRVDEALAQAHRFAANAAHELRTPLTAVRAEWDLLAERLAAEAPDPELAGEEAKTLTRVQQQLAHLDRLVARLLILSQPRRRAHDAFELVSLRDLVEDVAAGLPAEAQAQIILPVDDGPVRGDGVLLGTLVANALSNALKFGRRVEVSVMATPEGLSLGFDDDGPGVPAAERQRVFEPFYRGHLLSGAAGHGLGLALVRHIAETHNGSAEFVDKPTPGARLVVRLPLAPNAEVRTVARVAVDPGR